MEEQKEKDVNVVETQDLTEVKSYKEADSKLLNKVLVGLAAVLIGVLIYCNVNGISLFKKAEKKDLDDASKVKTTQSASYTPTSYTPTVSAGGPTNEIPSTTTETKTETPVETKKEETKVETKKEENLTPEEVEASWTTGKLSKEETITFAYYDAAEERESKLTNADKAYIQEYIDYYGISYEDARVCYLQNGPLVIPVDTKEYEPLNEPEYTTKYVFDADDLATINALMNELGYTRAEAENYYVTVIAPSLGKPLQTEIVMLLK